MRKNRFMQNAASVICIGILLIITVFTSTAQPYGDYTLYSKLNANKAYLLDLSGNEYHSWTFPSNQKTGYATYMEPGGTIIRSVAGSNSAFWGGATISTAVQKVDWNGNVLWHFNYSSSTNVLHHDICPMPNGNVLMIAYDLKTGSQVTQAGCSLNITLWSEKIMEVKPTGPTTGEIVWEWYVWDHLSQDLYSNKDNYVTSIVNNPQRLNINYLPKKDWMHMNGVDYNAVLDQITFSSHYMNEIYVIDHSTTIAEAAGETGGNSGKGGGILYRWGNPAAYGATGTKIFKVVHDAHWVPYDCPRGGYLAAFNNSGGANNKSCIDLINPPYSGYLYNGVPGGAYPPSTYDWRHTYSGSASSNMSSSQQLPNGNTFICMAMSGYLYEIDSNQNVVWSKNLGASIAKAYRYSAAWVNNTLGEESSKPPSQWLVYPNPSSSGRFNISGLNYGDISASVVNIRGDVIQAYIRNNELDLQHLSPGIYVVGFPDKPELGVRKVLITK